MARQTGTGYLENTTQAPLSSSNGPWFWGMWVKLDNTSQTLKYLAYLGDSGSIQTAWIYNFVTNKTELYKAGGSGTDPRPYSQITLSNTNWNHIAMRKNASGASSFDLFLNGTKTVGNASINFTFGAHSWSVYGAAPGGYNKTAASFAECIAIPAAPSDDQVAALAKGASGLSLGCLLKNGSYYPFIGRNSTECDIVGGRSMTTTSTNTVDHPRIFYSRPVDELTTLTGPTIGVLSGSSTISLAISGSVSGVGVVAASSSLTFAVSGTAVGNGVVAGTTSITLAASGAIAGVGVVAGDGTIAFAASATIEAAGVIAGTSAIMFGATGSIEALVSIAGTAGISFTGAAAITGAGVMIASSSITLSSAGEIAGIGVMAGTAGIAFTQVGEIIGLGTLAGTAAVVLGANGELIGVGELAAESTITLGASATIVGVGVVEGEATITFSASGSLDAPFVAWCLATGKESAKYGMVWIASAAVYTLELPAATAKYVLEWAGDCTMSCVCDTDKLTNVFKNARTFATVTATVAATGATTNSPTFTWTLKTRDGVTTLGTGTLTNSAAGGIYTIEIPLAVGALTTINVKYLLIIASSANEYEKQMEVLAINN